MTALHETMLGQPFHDDSLRSVAHATARFAKYVLAFGRAPRIQHGEAMPDPSRRALPDKPTARLPGESDIAAGSPRILVVDDDPLVLSGLCRLLRPFCQVIAASSAEDGLAIAASTPLAAVLTDYNMPGEDGLWLLRQVRSAQPEARRVLISGQEVAGTKELVEAGMLHAFVEKPMSLVELLAALALSKQ